MRDDHSRIALRFMRATNRPHQTKRADMQISSEVQALGYAGVRAKALEEWADFGSRFLGLQRVDKSRSTLAFRMDDRKQRLLVDADGGEGIGFMGWELGGAARPDG